ncbi:MAG TPA: DUF6531 domain-containing protein, partial [Vicinamibacterales bacterium]|nr:DUF6531 domain-containing protein [Vicinamibacterales bacterium]
YTISRAPENVYAISVGFGGDSRGGMRNRAQSELDRACGAGAPAADAGLRSRVLQVVGQQWLAQTAMMTSLNNRFDGSNMRFFYNIGLAAQTASPYVDLKNCMTYSTGDASRFNAYSLFASALEHAALDQVNGTNRPAVSTVRAVYLANKAGKPIYFGTTGNWSTVRASLADYTAATLGALDTSVTTRKRKVLLPQSGKITLNNWSSYAYIDYGPWGSGYSTSMTIGGGLAGGFASVPYVTPPADVSLQYSAVSLPSHSVSSYAMADPVDARSGAYLSEKTDLALGGPSPLSLARRYDSRLRGAPGPFGRGWTHNHGIKIHEYADPDAFTGRGSPAACAASAVACAAVNDLIGAGENAKNLATACLVVQWWADQLVGGAASVQAGGKSLSFTRSPDGSYVPAPGVTASLARTNSTAFVLSERLGPVWRFDTKGNLDRVTDASGNFTRLYYNAQTNLTAVSNSFGGKLTLAWSGGRVSSVSDSAGRSVSYAYTPSGCLASVTDAAGCVWKMSYAPDGALLAETEPGGTVSVRSAYNALGQVTNQLSAAGRVSTFAYADGSRTVQRDPLGGTAVSEFDADGRLTRRAAPDG